LENAIREEAGLALAAIARKEAEQMRMLDEAHAAEMEDFRKRILSQTEAGILQESSRAENRSGLDLKKLKLRSIEAFIGRSFETVLHEIRQDPRYQPFLFDAVIEAVGRASEGVEIRLSREDLACEDDIRVLLKTKAAGRKVSFVEDPSVKSGGCIIFDIAGGRIFDNSIERLYFRKLHMIRREVMTLMDEQSKKAGF
jgi:hypothetical protein